MSKPSATIGDWFTVTSSPPGPCAKPFFAPRCFSAAFSADPCEVSLSLDRRQ